MSKTLKARRRTDGGKGVARKLRQGGEIPAVAYGHGKESQSLSVNTHELELLLATINPENTIIDLEIEGGDTTPALIRQVQHHPSRPIILHVDFFQVRAGEKIHVPVPVVLVGNPVGVRDQNGILQEVLRELTVECLPRNIPAEIEINIEDLEIGSSVHVSQVSVPNATILNDGDLVICTVSTPTVEALPEDATTEDGVGGEVDTELVSERGEDARDVASEQGSAQPE
jgi:large subunit ribosomal protein L25